MVRGELWAATDTAIWHQEPGSDWERVYERPDYSRHRFDPILLASYRGSLYAASDSLMRWTGKDWETVAGFLPPGAPQAFVVLSPVDIVVAGVGSTGLSRWNGTEWLDLPVPAEIVTANGGMGHMASADDGTAYGLSFKLNRKPESSAYQVNGTSVSAVPTAAGTDSLIFSSIAVLPDGGLAIGGVDEHAIYWRRNGQWQSHWRPQAGSIVGRSIWVTEEGILWVPLRTAAEGPTGMIRLDISP